MEFDWKDIDIPESKEPTEPRRAIFSEASVKSKRELLMADFLITTTALPFDLELDEIAEPVRVKLFYENLTFGYITESIFKQFKIAYKNGLRQKNICRSSH